MELLKRTIRWPLVAAVLLAIVAGCSGNYRLKLSDLEADTAWPFYHGDAASTGALPQADFAGKLDVVWENDLGDKPVGPLTIYNNHLVFPGGKNKIKFIRLYDGASSGHIKPKGFPQTGVVVYKGRGLFATAPRKSLLKCINLLDGDKEWDRYLSDATSGALVVNDLFVVGASSGVLEAFKPFSGDIAWRFTAESRFNAPPAFDGELIYQPGDNGILYALSPVDGTERFRTELNGPMTAAVAVADKVYATDIDGHVYGIDKKTGEIIWRQQLDGPIWTSPAVSSEMVFVGHSGGEVAALDATNGRLIWIYDAVDVITASVVVVGDYVIAGTLAGELLSLKASDGTLVDRRELGSAISTAAVSDGRQVYVTTDKGLLTCFGTPALAENSDK